MIWCGMTRIKMITFDNLRYARNETSHETQTYYRACICLWTPLHTFRRSQRKVTFQSLTIKNVRLFNIAFMQDNKHVVVNNMILYLSRYIICLFWIFKLTAEWGGKTLLEQSASVIGYKTLPSREHTGICRFLTKVSGWLLKVYNQ